MQQKKNLYFFIVLCILLAVSIYASQRPYYNWDMFPYMALVERSDKIPFDSTHARIYREAESYMIASDFASLSQRQPLLRKDANAFERILKYYDVKPGYILIVKGFHSIGIDAITATFLPSLISYVFIGCLLLFWLEKYFSPLWASIVTILICALPFLTQTLRYSSPDLLCAAVCLTGIFLLIYGGIYTGIIVGLLAITIRPDAVIPFILILLALMKNKKISTVSTLAFSFSGMILSVIIMHGFKLIPEFLITTSASPNTSTFIDEYTASLWSGLSSFLNSSVIPFIMLGTITLYIRLAQPRVNSQRLTPLTLSNRQRADLLTSLVIAALTSFLIRYLLHPMIEDRFIIAGYLLIIIAFCDTLMILLKSKSTAGYPRKTYIGGDV